MNFKNLLNKMLVIALPLGVAMASLCFSSCEKVDDDAWKVRNEEFVRKVASEAKANADGKWVRILSFKLDSVDAYGNPVEHGVEDYIYCHKEISGVGEEHPNYTDFVSVNYRGRLISTASASGVLECNTGTIFDESYKGELNPQHSAPRNFFVDELIVGWSTALMQMSKGDRWIVYIPANLGYGVQKQGGIPENSTLVFDLNLVDFSE